MKRFIARLVLFAIAAVFLDGGWLLLVPVGNGSGQMLDISPGASSWDIARELQSAGVIRSAVAFEFWHLIHPHRKLKAGTYLFDSHSSTLRAFRRIARGDIFTYALTVPEGYNRFDIAQAVASVGIMSVDDFLKETASPALIHDIDPAATSLEGYLFPDTYRVPPRIEPHQLAAMMVKRFRDEVRFDGQRMFGPGGTWAGGDATEHPASIHEWVTMASLVEKESALPDERAMIAGLFYNRLSRGMPLQCDPTVIYAELLDRRYSGTLHHDDLNYRSAYNTYVRVGLPPGPIANPGRQSLLAAAHPQANDYLYFVSNGHGAHRFARTLEEHDRNVALLRHDTQHAKPAVSRN